MHRRRRRLDPGAVLEALNAIRQMFAEREGHTHTHLKFTRAGPTVKRGHVVRLDAQGRAALAQAATPNVRVLGVVEYVDGEMCQVGMSGQVWARQDGTLSPGFTAIHGASGELTAAPSLNEGWLVVATDGPNRAKVIVK